jgi:hypothetical protein
MDYPRPFKVNNINNYSISNLTKISGDNTSTLKDALNLRENKKIKFRNIQMGSSVSSVSGDQLDMLKKKRYIKNNKFVYLHPSSNLAKKLQEAVMI